MQKSIVLFIILLVMLAIAAIYDQTDHTATENKLAIENSTDLNLTPNTIALKPKK